MFVGVDGGPPDRRDLVLYPREFSGQSEGYAWRRIAETSEHVDPGTYPLLFPTGDPLGWCPDLQQRADAGGKSVTRTRITTIMFYSYMLMMRVVDGVRRGLGICGSLLLQQYVVDAYIKAELQTLESL